MQGDEQEQELTGGEPQLRRCNSSGEEPNNSGTTSDDEERSQQVFVYKELSAIRRSIKEQSRQQQARCVELENWSAELQVLASRLQAKEKSLRLREECVAATEQLACEAHDSMILFMKEEISHCAEDVQKVEIPQLKAALNAKTKENLRIASSYEALKRTNEELRRQLQEAQERNAHLEIQKKSLQRRLTASLRKSEQLVTTKPPSPAPLLEQAAKTGVPPSTYCELLGVALSWVYHLHSALPASSEQTWVRSRQVCQRLLPSLAEVLPEVAAMGPEGQLSYLEFVHWSVSNLDGGKQQRTMLAPSLRRIGEEVYREASPFRGDTTGELEGALSRPTSVRQARDSFMGSSELRVRVVSCLVALSTLTRVDSLAHVMDALKIELKEDVVHQCLFNPYHLLYRLSHVFHLLDDNLSLTYAMTMVAPSSSGWLTIIRHMDPQLLQDYWNCAHP
eukprot:Em0022g370a